MKKAEAVEVGLKVLSLYAFLEGINALAVPISLRESQITIHASTSFPAAAFIPSALLFVFGIILWLNAKRTESSSIVEKSAVENAIGLTPRILQGIVFSALGILIITQSLAPLGNLISAISAISALYFLDNHAFISRFPYYRLIEAFAKLIFGIWLIIGSRSLRKFQSWLLENVKSIRQ